MLKEPLILPGEEAKDMDSFKRALEANLDAAQNDPDFVKELQRDRIGNPRPLAPRVVDAETWVEDQQKAASSKADKWLRNTMKPRKDPKTRAKAARQKYINALQESLDNDSWVKGIDGYDEASMMETIQKVGEAGYRNGVKNKKHKMLNKVKKMQPLTTALAATLDQMPVDTADQRAAKMVAARDGMIAIKKRLREG